MSDAPATRALAAEVRTRVREGGLLLWLDVEKQYSEFVDALTSSEPKFPYPVLGLRGSFLELMLALEPYGNGLRPEHALVHLPGINKTTVRETPVYELYKAAIVFEKNLGTLIREASVGIATPEEVDAFVREPGLSLAKADQWLESLRSHPKDHLGLLLSSLSLDDVALGLITGDSPLRDHVEKGSDQILSYLQKNLGLDANWRAFRIEETAITPSVMSALVASWVMAVEFVKDLREPPITPVLQGIAKIGPVAKESRRIASLFRQRCPGTTRAPPMISRNYSTKSAQAITPTLWAPWTPSVSRKLPCAQQLSVR